ncbi:probable sulfate transporter 3.5 [Zingiber officinale]|uniref:probable sulfate transporter 3.5 n=1 Tax=Zingiber officinale TaxID=94328 RepID=UPI001C4CF1E0|nr:probable sulfate transporter 3.5 [Zingiber officinale]
MEAFEGAVQRNAVNFSGSGQTFLSSFRSDLKETLLPDDPFRHLKGQPAGAVTVGLLRYFVPILEWAPSYSFAKFKYDLLAGVTIASLAIPQGISYARLANLPPVIGLYSSFVPPLVYALFGSSTSLAVGTVAGASLFLASIIGSVASATEDPQLYSNLFFTAAFCTGVIEAALGILRLGILVDFLSRSTITGFMAGTACIVILQQLKGFLGLLHSTHRTDVVSTSQSLFTQTNQWRWQSVVLGVFFFGFLLLTKHIRNKIPRLFWLPVIAPLIVVVVGCVFAYLVHAEDHGIHIVGPLKKGLNPISISDLNFQSKYLSTVLNASLMAAFLALSEGIAVGRSLGILKNEQTDGNKEMIAFGLMNILGSFFSCYLTTGPFSRSAVNYHAGCKTQMSNVIMAICMMLVLLFLAPVFEYTPLVALSAIITIAMIGLIDYEEAYRLFKVDKYDFCICMSAFLGVVFFSMTIGLLVSVMLSILRALLYVARPTSCKLGNIAGTELYRDVMLYPNSKLLSETLIIELGSPIYFAAAGYLKERILRWVEEEENIANKDEHLKHVILDMGGVTAIDNTGIGMLFDVHRNLQKKEIKISLVNPRPGVVEKLISSRYIEIIGGEERVFLSIKEAIALSHFS